MDESSCHLSLGPQLLPGWEWQSSPKLALLSPVCQSISSLTWTTDSNWMGVYVISHLDHCSCLSGSPCHLSHEPLLWRGFESMSSLTSSTALDWMGVLVISHLVHCSSLDVSPCHLSNGPLFPPGCEALSSLTWTTANGWM